MDVTGDGRTGEAFTQGPFKVYRALLEKWQKSLNLVGPQTLSDILERHFQDSAQLLPFLPPLAPLGDMGSGAGFPGIVLALAGGNHVHLIESDGRKALFLEEVIRLTQAPATVHPVRLETYEGPPLETWVARAFAPLDKLLKLLSPHLCPRTRLVLLKGRKAQEEVEHARREWQFQVEFHPSLTHSEGKIVILTEVCKR
jgi:16S rRNA (guanine527-N7)-methyltransferase